MALTTSTLGKEVPIPMIEKELRALWESNTESTRASLINLAIYSEADDALERNTALLAEITREHASRALLIAAGIKREATPPRAWITAHCNLTGHKKSVCSEQIAFELNGKAVGRIRNTVFAHLDSDLPLVLWWQGELSRIFEPRFYSIIDRLIVDSSDWSDPAESFSKLTEAIENSPLGLIVHDLSWSRTHLLRASLASLFEDSRCIAELAKVQSVKIAHSANQRITAQLLVAWLASALKWQSPTAAGTGYTFTSDTGQSIQVDLTPYDGNSPVSSIVIITEGGEFSVKHEDGSKFVKAGSSLCGAQLFPADPAELAALVSGQLARHGNNHLLLETLPCLQSLLQLSE